MKTLNEIYHASYDYDKDVRVMPTSAVSFELWVYSSQYGWEEVKQSKGFLRDDQVNEHLNNRYTLRSTHSFSGMWEYRITWPTWDECRKWLYVWYAEQECKAVGDVKRAYMDIWAYCYERCTLQEALQWANKRKEWYQEDQKLAVVYNELVDILNSYETEEQAREGSMNTTPENLVQQIDMYVHTPSTLVANAQGAWRDARDEQQPYSRQLILKTATEYLLEGWGGNESFGHYVDDGLFSLYWRHERLAHVLEKVICELVDDYLETERQVA